MRKGIGLLGATLGTAVAVMLIAGLQGELNMRKKERALPSIVASATNEVRKSIQEGRDPLLYPTPEAADVALTELRNYLERDRVGAGSGIYTPEQIEHWQDDVNSWLHRYRMRQGLPQQTNLATKPYTLPKR